MAAFPRSKMLFCKLYTLVGVLSHFCGWRKIEVCQPSAEKKTCFGFEYSNSLAFIVLSLVTPQLNVAFWPPVAYKSVYSHLSQPIHSVIFTFFSKGQDIGG